MRILVDTNVFLEVLLDQRRADEARVLLSQFGRHQLYLSDYSLHSIGVLPFRRKQAQMFGVFASDIVQSGSVSVAALESGDMDAVVEAAAAYDLDFDDAYQYVTARKLGLRLVSSDRDFDRVPGVRLLPSKVLRR